MIIESQSYFERSERVKRFTQDFLMCHRTVGFPNFAEYELKGDRTTLCGLHFAVVSDKLDLLSNFERRLDKENDNFNCLNKSV